MDKDATVDWQQIEAPKGLSTSATCGRVRSFSIPPRNHLFDFILADFEVPIDSRYKSDALMRLNRWLIGRYRAGADPVLILEEAQDLPVHPFVEIRMLLNLETSCEKSLQIVLARQMQSGLGVMPCRNVSSGLHSTARPPRLPLPKLTSTFRDDCASPGQTGRGLFPLRPWTPFTFIGEGFHASRICSRSRCLSTPIASRCEGQGGSLYRGSHQPRESFGLGYSAGA